MYTTGHHIVTHQVYVSNKSTKPLKPTIIILLIYVATYVEYNTFYEMATAHIFITLPCMYLPSFPMGW